MCVFTGKQFVKVFDGDDALRRGSFRLVSVLRATKTEDVVVRAPPLPKPRPRPLTPPVLRCVHVCSGGRAEGLSPPRPSSGLRTARGRRPAASPWRRLPGAQPQPAEGRRRRLAPEGQRSGRRGHPGVRRLAQVSTGETAQSRPRVQRLSPAQERRRLRVRPRVKGQHLGFCSHSGPRTDEGAGKVQPGSPVPVGVWTSDRSLSCRTETRALAAWWRSS